MEAMRSQWIAFYDVGWALVIRFVMKAGPASLEDARDAAQEAFVESWREMATWPDERRGRTGVVPARRPAGGCDLFRPHAGAALRSDDSSSANPPGTFGGSADQPVARRDAGERGCRQTSPKRRVRQQVQSALGVGAA
jgi:hypothetical protein